jgi:ribonuclease-3
VYRKYSRLLVYFFLKKYREKKKNMIRRDLLQKILGECIVPNDLSLYTEALVHKSAKYAYQMSQERLEHLGDAVLSLCVCHMLFEQNPEASEGVMTKMRTRLVNGKTLAYLGRAMGVSDGIVLDQGAIGALDHDRIFEDTFEAIVGAVYLDQGLDAAKKFVSYQYDKYIDPETVNNDTNYKDILKRKSAKRGLQLPNYTSKNMNGVFQCTVHIGDVIYSHGEGHSKKNSEMEAAHNCILNFFPE